MTAPLKVAVVGAGGWGRQHARIFAGRADTRLCAVVSRTPERARARAAEHGATAYTDVDAMLDREQPDLVSVCLPNEAHFAPTLHLLRRGAALLVEKPLVFDLAEADTLIAATAEHGAFLAVNFNHRYAEPVLRARRAIADGTLGDIVFATWRFGGEPNIGTSPHGNLVETQCHAFDLLEHLCGPISGVMAQMTDRTHPGYYTTVALALEFASGAVGTLLGSYDSSYAYPGAHLMELNGTEGRALIEDTVAGLTLSRRGDDTAQVWRAGYFDDEARSFHHTFDRHVDAVVAALRAGDPPPVPATAGRRALELATAAVTSFETGTRVPTGGTP